MVCKTASRLWVCLFCSVLLVFAGTAALADEQKKNDADSAAKDATANERAKSDEVVVFTNDDLDRMFAEDDPSAPPVTHVPESPPAAPGEDAAPGPAVRQVDPASPAEGGQTTDPLQWMQERKAQQVDRDRQIAEAEQKVSGLQDKVTELEKRILATRNPLLARPKIPDDEREEWASKTSPERVEFSQDQLDQAKAELAEAQRELTRLRGSQS